MARNAGHVLPVWLKKQLAGERVFETGGMPIGFLPGSEYQEAVMGFHMGERLAIFSDGVTEAENIDGIQYEGAGLTDSFTRVDNYMLVEQIGNVFLTDLDRFRIGAPAKDDTTLLVVGIG